MPISFIIINSDVQPEEGQEEYPLFPSKGEVIAQIDAHLSGVNWQEENVGHYKDGELETLLVLGDEPEIGDTFLIIFNGAGDMDSVLDTVCVPNKWTPLLVDESDMEAAIEEARQEGGFDFSEFGEDDRSGIDLKEKAHPRCLKLIADDFFYDAMDELGPFGSDEGYAALEEYRRWQKENKKGTLLECLQWVVEEFIGDDFANYNPKITNPKLLKEYALDPNFDSYMEIDIVDWSVIATGFGQLLDFGKIEPTAKPTIKIALDRQLAWNHILIEQFKKTDPEQAEVLEEFVDNVKVLQKLLAEA